MAFPVCSYSFCHEAEWHVKDAADLETLSRANPDVKTLKLHTENPRALSAKFCLQQLMCLEIYTSNEDVKKIRWSLFDGRTPHLQTVEYPSVERSS
jgi:hypothetical protein